MGVSAAIFESAGKRSEHFVPGAYSRSNSVSNARGVSAGNMVIIGACQGGKPDTLLTFGSLSDAKDILIDGDLLTAVGYAFNCSPDYKPSIVNVIRVNKGTQSSLQLKNNSDNVLLVKSWDYGPHCNQLKMKVESGTIGKKITVSYKGSSVVYKDVFKKSISIKNTGGSSLSVNVDSTKLSCGGTDITFEEYPTISSIVDKLNEIDDIEATLLNDGPSNLLDNQTVAINTNTTGLVKSDLQAIIETLETCEFIGSVTYNGTARKVIDNSTEEVSFSGGTSGSTNTQAFVDALKVLETEDIQIITTYSTDSAVHALIKTHCEEMSNVNNRKERTCILGGPLNTTNENGIAAAEGFNSKYVSYVIDSGIATNPLTGKNETVTPAIIAVMASAMESSMSVNEPLTNKNINIISFTKKRTITDMSELIQGGVMVFNSNPDDTSKKVCIRAITTCQDDDLTLNERSMVREDLYMNRDLRKRYGGGIGSVNNADLSSVVQTLKDAAIEWKNSGLIIPSGSDNVWNIRASVNGDVIKLDYDCYLTAPRNFVFITATNHVYKASVEL